MKQEKIIIENRTELPISDILVYVKAVMDKGRISNFGKQYCYLTVFGDGITVVSDLNKKSDKFIVYKKKLANSILEYIHNKEKEQ